MTWLAWRLRCYLRTSYKDVSRRNGTRSLWVDWGWHVVCIFIIYRDSHFPHLPRRMAIWTSCYADGKVAATDWLTSLQLIMKFLVCRQRTWACFFVVFFFRGAVVFLSCLPFSSLLAIVITLLPFWSLSEECALKGTYSNHLGLYVFFWICIFFITFKFLLWPMIAAPTPLNPLHPASPHCPTSDLPQQSFM